MNKINLSSITLITLPNTSKYVSDVDCKEMCVITLDGMVDTTLFKEETKRNRYLYFHTLEHRSGLGPVPGHILYEYLFRYRSDIYCIGALRMSLYNLAVD